jgi:hypothetical protein
MVLAEKTAFTLVLEELSLLRALKEIFMDSSLHLFGTQE